MGGRSGPPVGASIEANRRQDALGVAHAVDLAEGGRQGLPPGAADVHQGAVHIEQEQMHQ